MYKRGFAGAGDAGDEGERAEWDGDVDLLQVVGAGADDFELLAAAPSAAGYCDLLFTTQVSAGGGVGAGDPGRGSGGDHFAAGTAGAGANFNDVVGLANGHFIVLDNDDGVAPVAQSPQGP